MEDALTQAADPISCAGGIRMGWMGPHETRTYPTTRLDRALAITTSPLAIRISPLTRSCNSAFLLLDRYHLGLAAAIASLHGAAAAHCENLPMHSSC
jgi:hypothetical protein